MARQLPERFTEVKERYYSAIDTWLAILLVGTPTFFFAYGAATLAESPQEGISLIGGGFSTLIVFWLCVFPCHYTFEEDHLAIRGGIIRHRVDYKNIHTIDTSKSLLNGPALSLKRVSIKAGAQSILVSPKNREKFINELWLRTTQFAEKS